MLTVKENKSGAVFEIRPWVKGDKEGQGIAFGIFAQGVGGYKFVCSCISCPEKPDIDWAQDFASWIAAYSLLHKVEFQYDPHPPYLYESKMADMLRLQKDSTGKNKYEVVQKIPPVDRSNYRPDVFY